MKRILQSTAVDSVRSADGTRHPRVLSFLFSATVLLVTGGMATAQEPEETPAEMPTLLNSDHISWMPEALARGAPTVLSAFEPVVSNASSSVATVLADGIPIALGTVVDSDGLLLTKASQLDGESVTCRLADGRHLHAVILGEDDEQDLALVKVAADDLKPVTWCKGDVPKAGQWVITPGMSPTPVAIGVVSAAPRSWRMRRQDRPRGFLGVQLEAGESNTVRVVRVIRGLAADKAGVEAGDVIARIGDEDMESVGQVIRKLGGTPPETSVTVGLIRSGDEELSIEATLGEMRVRSPELRWGGGPFSDRRFEFPNVLPHDTTLLPIQCGGPLLDMDGRAVGINIARALRVASYALTAQDVRRALQRLRAEAPTDVEVSADPITGDLPERNDVTAEGGVGKDDISPRLEEALADAGGMQLIRQWVKAVHDGDADAVEEVTDKLIEHRPGRKAAIIARSAQVFLGVLHDHDRGYEWADRLADGDADAELLNEISWFIFTDERVEERDLDCGMKLARLAVKRSRGRNGAVLDTLARGHFEQGDIEQAIKTQMRARKRARGQSRAVIRETLERYKRARHSI